MTEDGLTFFPFGSSRCCPRKWTLVGWGKGGEGEKGSEGASAKCLPGDTTFGFCAQFRRKTLALALSTTRVWTPF